MQKADCAPAEAGKEKIKKIEKNLFPEFPVDFVYQDIAGSLD